MANPILMAKFGDQDDTDKMMEEAMLDDLLGTVDWAVDPADLERERLRYVHNTKRRNQYADFLETAIVDCDDIWNPNPEMTPHFGRTTAELLKYIAYGIIFDVDASTIEAGADTWRRLHWEKYLLSAGIAERRQDAATGCIKIYMPPRHEWDSIVEKRGAMPPDWNDCYRDVCDMFDAALEKKINRISEDIEISLAKKLRNQAMKSEMQATRKEREAEQARLKKQADERAALGWGEF